MIKKIRPLVVLAGVFLFCSASWGQGLPLPGAENYYGERFQRELRRLESGDRGDSYRWRSILHRALSEFHLSEAGKPDRIVDRCPGYPRPGVFCFQRRSLSYREARELLFGDTRFHLRSAAAAFGGSPHSKMDRYWIRGVYCNHDYTSRELGRNGLGPGRIPNHNIINTEHTWPQSRFYKSPRGFMKTDLHHLFPSNSRANSVRGNHRFGEVDERYGMPRDVDCEDSRVGPLRGGGGSATYFEPPDGHKGNVARALFYFAVRYDMEIDSTEEFFLRKWHEEDAVDDFERSRNEAIYSVQYLRNPFIDYPQLVSVIEDY